MRFSSFTAAAGLMGASVAAPSPASAPLSYDDVILIGDDGAHQIVKAAEYDALQTRALSSSPILSASASHSRRGCQESTEVQVISDEEFLNWDIPMSPIALGGAGTTVTVSNGHSVANSVSVGVGLSTTIAQIALGISLSVSYSETWTTTEDQSLAFQVPEGNYGLIVSQPLVRRVTGNIFSGCTDAPTKSDFVSDSYTSENFGKLSWVKGVIRLCNSTTYPVPFCIGDGQHR